MRDSASVKLRWALSSGTPGWVLPSTLGLFRPPPGPRLPTPPWPPVSSPTVPPERPAPRVTHPRAYPCRTCDPPRHPPPEPAAATPPPPPPTAPLSLSSAGNSSPCAWMRWPSPWCRPAPHDPTSPAPPAGKTPAPAGITPTAHPGGPCGSRRWCESLECCSPPAPESVVRRQHPKGDVLVEPLGNAPR